MMNYIWLGMILFSCICAVFQGNMEATSNAVLLGAGDAVGLCLKLLGTMCLWNGMMKIAERSGLTQGISRLLHPVLKLVFPDIERNSPAGKAISMNISANLLGLGNAATPLGIKAMEELQKRNPLKDTATQDMVCFVVMNTAAFDLVPTTIAMLRQQFGAKNPMDIMIAVWLTSFTALVVALLAAKLMRGRHKPCSK